MKTIKKLCFAFCFPCMACLAMSGRLSYDAQLKGKRAISKLINSNFKAREIEAFREAITDCMKRLNSLSPQSGKIILQIDYLESLLDLIDQLEAYERQKTAAGKNDLLLIADTYGDDVGMLIHTIIDPRK